MAELRAGDVGTVIRFVVTDETGTPVNLATALLAEVVIASPYRAETQVVAAELVTDGADGTLQFTTTAQTFARTGTHRLQVHLVFGAGEWRSTVALVNVEPAL